ncbi:hypothetical protein TARUN_4854 [Trichoderma arundinaceum]|uniref:Uncharacterized protein n=1 Tax=Trichoderma arundinaceum TaxID=490622 RepID=A0A395NN03_TRIAR|nr:hypothetical protein TARUN_4854 [Trichoderma arundinaceum]
MGVRTLRTAGNLLRTSDDRASPSPSLTERSRCSAPEAPSGSPTGGGTSPPSSPIASGMTTVRMSKSKKKKLAYQANSTPSLSSGWPKSCQQDLQSLEMASRDQGPGLGAQRPVPTWQWHSRFGNPKVGVS